MCQGYMQNFSRGFLIRCDVSVNPQMVLIIVKWACGISSFPCIFLDFSFLRFNLVAIFKGASGWNYKIVTVYFITIVKFDLPEIKLNLVAIESVWIHNNATLKSRNPPHSISFIFGIYFEETSLWMEQRQWSRPMSKVRLWPSIYKRIL